MIEPGKKYLVTADDWFLGPDGENYKAAWGTAWPCRIEESLGFVPLRPSTNWFLKIGENGREVILAGCRIHYAVRCDSRPVDPRQQLTFPDKENGLTYSAARIYIAE